MTRLLMVTDADGSIELIAAPEFSPKLGAAIVLRDLSGAWFAGSGSTLRPATREEAAEAVRGLRTYWAPGRSDALPRDSLRRRSRYIGRSVWEDVDDVEDAASRWIGRVVPEEPPPGTYVAAVDAAPAEDDLGRRVRWTDERRLVVGYVSENDFER